jgi:hypothetical protein
MRTSPTSHRRTAKTDDRNWALRYVKTFDRPPRHRMTRATLRRHRASQKRASKIRVHRPLQPVWLRMAQTAATWVF